MGNGRNRRKYVTCKMRDRIGRIITTTVKHSVMKRYEREGTLICVVA